MPARSSHWSSQSLPYQGRVADRPGEVRARDDPINKGNTIKAGGATATGGVNAHQGLPCSALFSPVRRCAAEWPFMAERALVISKSK